MSIKKELEKRSGSKCELCGSEDELSVYEVAPCDGSAEQSILICSKCKEQIEDPSKMDANHWHCLNDSMWSEQLPVQVMAYRLLKRLGNQDMADMLYFEDDIKAWADADSSNDVANSVPTKDTNGAVLNAGDSVTIIKDLEVKGAGFTAKRGTVVKNIALTDNPEQIEGRVNGTRIVLLTKFLKKV